MPTAPDPTVTFFEELATRSDEPLLRKASGVTALEIVDGRTVRRWLVEVDKGQISVHKGSGAAGCVVRADKAVFDKIASGKLNAVAAVLRGDVAVQGDWRLLVRMQRLFPSPPSARTRNPRTADSGRAKTQDARSEPRTRPVGRRRRR